MTGTRSIGVNAAKQPVRAQPAKWSKPEHFATWQKMLISTFGLTQATIPAQLRVDKTKSGMANRGAAEGPKPGDVGGEELFDQAYIEWGKIGYPSGSLDPNSVDWIWLKAQGFTENAPEPTSRLENGDERVSRETLKLVDAYKLGKFDRTIYSNFSSPGGQLYGTNPVVMFHLVSFAKGDVIVDSQGNPQGVIFANDRTRLKKVEWLIPPPSKVCKDFATKKNFGALLSAEKKGKNFVYNYERGSLLTNQKGDRILRWKPVTAGAVG